MTSGWRPLGHDPITGMTEWFSTPDDGDTWHIKYEQDAKPFLDANKEQQADGWDKSSEMWHAARVPLVVLMEWLTKYGVQAWNPDHKDGVKRLLNHPDYRYIRVNHFIV